MKKLIGSLVLVLLCALPIHAGPNAGAKIALALNRTSGFVKGDEIKVTVLAKGCVQVTAYEAEVLFDSVAVTFRGSQAKFNLYTGSAYSGYRAISGFLGFNSRAEGGGQINVFGGSYTGDYEILTFVFSANADFLSTNFGIRLLTLYSGSQADEIYPSFSPLVVSINGSTSTPKAFIPAIPGDLNMDGAVNFDDFFLFAQNFGKNGPVPTGEVKIGVQTVTVRDTVTVTRTVTLHDTLKVLTTVTGVRYTNNFSDSTTVLTWAKLSNATWGIQGGQLFLYGLTSGFLTTFVSSQSFPGDIDLTVATEWKKGLDNDYGVQFRISAAGRYEFGITPNGYYRIAKWNGKGQHDLLQNPVKNYF